MLYSFSSYPTYRPSGVEWLGEVPAHWEIRRFKYLLRERDTRSVDGSEQLLRVSQYTGVTQRKRTGSGDEPDTRAESLVGYKSVEPNDFVVNIMLAWNGSMGVSKFHGIASPAYCVYRFRMGTHPWYFHHLLRSPAYKAHIKAVSTGVVASRLRLYTDDLYRIEALFPPLPEQTTIVRYLDHADERIHRYVSGKQKIIRLLEEEKQAIIHRAVTRGLDPNVRLKHSGVEGVGDVPAHWEVRRLKTLCSMKSGDGITETSIEPAGEYPVYGGNGLRGYTSNYTHDGHFALIGRQGALCGNVHIARGRFWASEHAVVATLHPSQVLEWFGAILGAMNLNQYSLAAAQPGLAVERVLNLWLPVPPSEEQAVIATHIEQQTADIDTAISRTRRQIELLQEYRTRLIADVVTGKLDVRGAAANLPDAAYVPQPPETVKEPDRGDQT